MAPQPLGGAGRGRPGLGTSGGNIRQEAYQQRMQGSSGSMGSSTDRDLANLDAATALKAMMNSEVSTRTSLIFVPEQLDYKINHCCNAEVYTYPSIIVKLMPMYAVLV